MKTPPPMGTPGSEDPARRIGKLPSADQLVYRKQIRSVLQAGAVAMDRISKD
jgi:hypothetical protein